jgi:hypothetical protein
VNLGLRQRLVEVVPIGIEIENEPRFPGARPLFHVLLALNRIGNCFVALVIDEAFQTMAFRKAVDEAFAALINPTRQIRVTPV